MNAGGNTVSLKVYVGNLPYSFTDKELTELFSLYGTLSEVVVIRDKYSGRSKGFGFVTFADESSANKAIAEMDGKEIEGRALKVNEAKPLDPNGPPKREFRSRRRF